MPKDSRETIPQSTCARCTRALSTPSQLERESKSKHPKSLTVRPKPCWITRNYTTQSCLTMAKRGPQSVPSLLQPGSIHNLVKAGPYDTYVTAMFSAEQLGSSSADSMRLLCCEYLPTTAVYPELGSTTWYLCLAMHAMGVSYVTLYQPYGFSRLMD
ncbi:hypothetical protein NEUTE2DRAFT_130228 [Neurospora tetrasperma FGSC 2509]|nr:hypothetical protein NEUTE2DRAFT_130228 [Neurospora tetrasperma FGSC 2509]